MSNPIPPNQNSEAVLLEGNTTSVDPEKKLKDNLVTRNKLLEKAFTLCSCAKVLEYTGIGTWAVALSVGLIFAMIGVLFALGEGVFWPLIVAVSLLGTAVLLTLTFHLVHTAYLHYAKKAKEPGVQIWKERAPKALKALEEGEKEVTQTREATLAPYLADRKKLEEYLKRIREAIRGLDYNTDCFFERITSLNRLVTKILDQIEETKQLIDYFKRWNDDDKRWEKELIRLRKNLRSGHPDGDWQYYNDGNIWFSRKDPVDFIKNIYENEKEFAKTFFWRDDSPKRRAELFVEIETELKKVEQKLKFRKRGIPLFFCLLCWHFLANFFCYE